MTQPDVYILEKEATVGEWLLNHLNQISVRARWVSTLTDLLSASEVHAPVICLVALHPPVSQVLTMITNLIQEPRFAQTAFILMGPIQYKHAAFEAGADDYLTTPPDVIELRKRVRLYLDRAALEARLIAETSLGQEIAALYGDTTNGEEVSVAESISLLQHAAAATEERNRFELILRSAGSALALVAPNGSLQYTNPAWERLFAPQPVTDSLPFGWPPVATNPATTRAIAEAITEPVAWQGEARFSLNGSRELDLSLSITPAFDGDNALAGYVLALAALDHRAQTEDFNTQFVSDAAAQMRTPVTNIKMRQYLLREAPPEQHDMHLAALESETERLLYLVEAVLALARLDAGLVHMAVEPVNLHRLVSEAIIRYGPTADHKGIMLSMGEAAPLPEIRIAPPHIAGALGALIENAIQHTPENGRITVQIGAEQWSGGQYQTIQVCDTGTGIAPDDMPRIFDRFYRSESTQDSGIRGEGLGLSIAKEIIERHQGIITVESVLGEGSTFTIWLPE